LAPGSRLSVRGRSFTGTSRSLLDLEPTQGRVLGDSAQPQSPRSQATPQLVMVGTWPWRRW